MFLNSLLSLFAILLILQLPHATQGVSGLSEASKRVFSQSPFPSPVLNAPQHFESGQFTPPSPPHVVPSCHDHLKRRRSLLQLSLPEIAVLNCRVHFKGCNFLALKRRTPASSGSVNSRRRRFLGERRHVSGWSHVVSKRLVPESPPPPPVANARVHFKRRRSLLSLPEVAVSSCRVHFKGCNFLAMKRRRPASSGGVNSGRRRFLGERRHVSGWSYVVSKRLLPESPPPPPVANARVHFKRRRSLLQLSLPEVAVSNCRVHFKGCNFLALKQRPPASNRCVHTKLRRFLGEPSPPKMVSNDRVEFKHRRITSTV
ncbi:hypothetical protein Patl1_23105 [Pistacia atlantica]|uniref:Uncharacterized protein n=1 Tax=Pistacia atlantica TaxID=434234 RepID=A0ACC0ZXR6_9ROSI|nr:hypothetical protein Patl1_23105 [Pistacia atlantica]